MRHCQPEPLKNYLAATMQKRTTRYIFDHHIFTIDDLKEIKKNLKITMSENKMIITTEKDAVR